MDLDRIEAAARATLRCVADAGCECDEPREPGDEHECWPGLAERQCSAVRALVAEVRRLRAEVAAFKRAGDPLCEPHGGHRPVFDAASSKPCVRCGQRTLARRGAQ